MIGNNETDEDLEPAHWCNVCSKDLQSKKSLQEHECGKRHRRKVEEAFRQHSMPNSQKRQPSSSLQGIDEQELFTNLRNGQYRNIVVLTGAGVSTAAGIPDFRSPQGLFETIRTTFGKRFPYAHDCPEIILSRDFVNAHPAIYQEEVVPILEHIGKSVDAQPTHTHHFCAWLYQRGWLRRVYTQNVDGLHVHPSLNIEEELVVECHGSMRKGNIVLYGDDLPRRFYNCCDDDFPENIRGADLHSNPVDLVLVFGTSLQVYPFCAIPNLAPKGCVRVLINRSLDDCIQTSHQPPRDDYGVLQSPKKIRIGSRKVVTLQNLWTGRKGNKRWRQLLVEGDCDDFVQRFHSYPSIENDENKK